MHVHTPHIHIYNTCIIHYNILCLVPHSCGSYTESCGYHKRVLSPCTDCTTVVQSLIWTCVRNARCICNVLWELITKLLVHASALKDFPHQEKDHLNHQKHITAMTMLPVYNVHTHNSGHTVIVGTH